jgi:NAD(P)-dependent dehydrogenase (short-subunit alcohol dehydrogenase family)
VSVGRLQGKTALVTGAGSGIGRAIAVLFAQQGANVVCGDRAAAVEETVEAIRSAGGTAISVIADVRDEQQVEHLVQAAVERFGPIDVLVANAGINPPAGPGAEIDNAVWRQVLDVNLGGVFLCCKHAARVMEPRRSGSIVALASVSGMVGWGGSAAYIASKGAVIALTRGLAADYGRAGIRVNCICPGTIWTPMVEVQFADLPDREERIQRNADRHLLGRVGTAEDVAFGALYLASDEASFVTGSSLVIDGGFSAV